jgi:nitrite reductase/ring-hydroxylating ferredoxin subunit
MAPDPESGAEGERAPRTGTPDQAGFVPVGRLVDFPEGRPVARSIGARRVVIYRVGGELFALKDICPHQGDSLHRLPPQEGAAVCIGHGWRFDLRSGECVRGDPGARVAVYPVEVRGDTVLVGSGRLSPARGSPSRGSPAQGSLPPRQPPPGTAFGQHPGPEGPAKG